MRPTRIYVGNLPFTSCESDLARIFAPYGQVLGVEFITKRANGRPRGFAYVEMATAGAARAAIEGLNGAQLSGRMLRVAAAKPSEGQAPAGDASDPASPR